MNFFPYLSGLAAKLKKNEVKKKVHSLHSSKYCVSNIVQRDTFTQKLILVHFLSHPVEQGKKGNRSSSKSPSAAPLKARKTHF